MVDAGDFTPDMVRRRLPELRGVIMQKPPVFSALKVGGKKLLNLAREGATVETEPREVAVPSSSSWDGGRAPIPRGFSRCGWAEAPTSARWRFRLGHVGCGATVSYLLRERAGQVPAEGLFDHQSLKGWSGKGGRTRGLAASSYGHADYPVLVASPGREVGVSHGVALKAKDSSPTTPGGRCPTRAIVAMPDGARSRQL